MNIAMVSVTPPNPQVSRDDPPGPFSKDHHHDPRLLSARRLNTRGRPLNALRCPVAATPFLVRWVFVSQPSSRPLHQSSQRKSELGWNPTPPQRLRPSLFSNSGLDRLTHTLSMCRKHELFSRLQCLLGELTLLEKTKFSRPHTFSPPIPPSPIIAASFPPNPHPHSSQRCSSLS